MHQIVQIDFENYIFSLLLRGYTYTPIRHPLSPQVWKFCQSLIWAPLFKKKKKSWIHPCMSLYHYLYNCNYHLLPIFKLCSNASDRALQLITKIIITLPYRKSMLRRSRFTKLLSLCYFSLKTYPVFPFAVYETNHC